MSHETNLIERNQIIESAELLLNELTRFSCFEEFFKDRREETADDCEWTTHQSFFDIDSLCIARGLTKMVIIDDNLDYVIKIPFAWVNGSISMKDYCRIEAENYQRAVDACVDEYFAECFYGGKFECELDGEKVKVPFYLMEKVDCDEEKVTSDICSQLDDSSYDCEYSSEAVEELFKLYYGADEHDRVYEFCEKMFINDIHTANVGFRNGRLVFVDYSGY